MEAKTVLEGEYSSKPKLNMTLNIKPTSMTVYKTWTKLPVSEVKSASKCPNSFISEI